MDFEIIRVDCTKEECNRVIAYKHKQLLWDLNQLYSIEPSPLILREIKIINTLKPLYKTIHYKTVRIKDGLKVDSKSVVSKQKCKDYIKMTNYGHFFLYNVDIFCLDTRLLR